MKPSFFLFLASATAMLISTSLWFAPLVAWFAALTIRDLIFRLPPASPMSALEIDNEAEADRMADRFARFRKALHD